MTTKDAIFRELKYALCGAGGALEGLVAADHVKLDLRSTPSSLRSESDYPWLIFRRATLSEDNQVKYAREFFELELIGLRSSATKGDALLETVRNLLLDHFAGKHKTFGKFTSGGVSDPSGGLKMRCRYVDSRDGFESDLGEKTQVLVFVFTHVRQ